jgi:hypothetical protein
MKESVSYLVHLNQDENYYSLIELSHYLKVRFGAVQNLS